MRKKQIVPKPVDEAPRQEADQAGVKYSGPERRRHRRIELD